MADQPSPRRRFQFRLSTLFVIVTVLASVCWVCTDRERVHRERDKAVEEANKRIHKLEMMLQEKAHRDYRENLRRALLPLDQADGG
jgi:hypothetical protein